jgi:hypothetical protein
LLSISVARGVFFYYSMLCMSWFTKPLVVEVEAPPESLEQKRARLHDEWRRSEDELTLSFVRLAKHDAYRVVLVAQQARAAECRNRLLQELAALAEKKK